jgi:glycosyltransferase involved in cell wall biosynthesis
MALEGLPRLSIVTPSYNQSQFLEETIRSVLDQDYPWCEYLVLDGGSTDGSAGIIQMYANKLAYWASEPDGGQYAAINAGFARATGDIFAWINADDKYTSSAFQVVGEIFATHPEIEWLTSLYPLVWDEAGRAVACYRREGYSRDGFMAGENLPGQGWYAYHWIQQESTFWRRSLWERAGGLDLAYPLAADFELWARFFQHAKLCGVETVLGGYRLHDAQKTAQFMEEYGQEAKRALVTHGGRPSGWLASLIRTRLITGLPWRIRRILPGWRHHRTCYYGGRAGGWIVDDR